MKNINVIIPMAGRGERFSKNGFDLPKPLIEIDGVTMIERAIKSLGFENALVQFIFITRKYSEPTYNQKLNDILNAIAPSNIQIEIDYVTAGPASTCLLAKQYIDNGFPLITCNCDQIMRWDGAFFLSSMLHSDYDGVVVTYEESTTKNSYAEVDEVGQVKRIAEKQVISNVSLNGIHFWKKGSDFVSSAGEMISNQEHYNNEFYIGPSYNQMINKGLKVGIFHIPKQCHIPVGVPEDLEKFLRK